MRNRMITYSLAAAFGALADPTRRAVLDLLLRGSLPAGRIAQAFPVSRPAISKHLTLFWCSLQNRGQVRFMEARSSGDPSLRGSLAGLACPELGSQSSSLAPWIWT